MGVWDDVSAGDGRMTKEAILKVCKETKNSGMWRTPELNEKLYLHFKGYPNIGGLEEYVNVRCLWMEGNAIGKIEGLDHLGGSLRTLFLHQNCIQEIEGLDNLTLLDTVNLSDNFIGRIANLSGCVQLRTLNLKGNKLCDLSDLMHLVDCPSITVLDVSENQIKDPAVVDEVFVKMPNLTILRLNGNPCINAIPHYRKTMVSKLSKLRHLDDRPIFDDERRMAEAWARGGLEEEKRERELMRKEADEKRAENMRVFDEMIARGRRQREENERLGIQPEHTEYWHRNHQNPEEDPIKRAFQKDGGREYLQAVQQAQADNKRPSGAEAAQEPVSEGPTEGKHIVHFALEDYVSDSDDEETEEKEHSEEQPAQQLPLEEEEGMDIETLEIEDSTNNQHRILTQQGTQRQAWETDAGAVKGSVADGTSKEMAHAPNETLDDDAEDQEEQVASDNLQTKRDAWDIAETDLITRRLQETEPHRPLVFGTAAYKELWNMACALPDPEPTAVDEEGAKVDDAEEETGAGDGGEIKVEDQKEAKVQENISEAEEEQDEPHVSPAD